MLESRPLDPIPLENTDMSLGTKIWLVAPPIVLLVVATLVYLKANLGGDDS